MNRLLRKVKWDKPEELVPATNNNSLDTVPTSMGFSEIIPGLYLTSMFEVFDKKKLIESGVTLILNLCADSSRARFQVYEFSVDLNDFYYREIEDFEHFVCELDDYSSNLSNPDISKREIFLYNIAALDTPTYPIQRHFPVTCALIKLVLYNRALVEKHKDYLLYNQSHAVIVHCALGISRSASIVAAYLIKTAGLTRAEALCFIKAIRPVIRPNPGFQTQLNLWECTRGQRIFDLLSAHLVASSIRNESDLSDYIGRYLNLFLKDSRFLHERHYLGFLISSINPSMETLHTVYCQIESHITEAILSDVQVDTPNFFHHVLQILISLETYCECILDTIAFHDPELVCSDFFYYKVFKHIVNSGVRNDVCDTVRSICSLFDEVDKRHLNSQSRLSVRLPRELCGTVLPECMTLSFPFLVFVAPYAQGFIKSSRLLHLRSMFSSENSVESSSSVQLLVHATERDFLDVFLFRFLGRRIDSSTDPLPEKQTEFSRFFSFIKNDFEVQVFYSLLSDPSLSFPLDVFVSNIKSTDCVIGRVLALKFVSGFLAFRLVLECVDCFLLEVCNHNNMVNVHVSEDRLPLAFIGTCIENVETAYMDNFGKSCEITSFLRKELEPLANDGIIQAEGLWSLLDKR